MLRLIDIDPSRERQQVVRLHVGDVMKVHAAGARPDPDDQPSQPVRLLGPFTGGVVVSDGGEVLTPAGPPSTWLVIAVEPGEVRVVWTFGDPFHEPRQFGTRLVVTP